MIRWTTTLMKQILILARALAFILILSIYQIASEFFYVRRIIYTLAFKCNVESNIVSNSNLLHIIICIKIKKARLGQITPPGLGKYFCYYFVCKFAPGAYLAAQAATASYTIFAYVLAAVAFVRA